MKIYHKFLDSYNDVAEILGIINKGYSWLLPKCEVIVVKVPNFSSWELTINYEPKDETEKYLYRDITAFVNGYLAAKS